MFSIQTCFYPLCKCIKIDRSGPKGTSGPNGLNRNKVDRIGSNGPNKNEWTEYDRSGQTRPMWTK